MDELLKRLEDAGCGSRELDAEIAMAFGVEYRTRRTRSGVNKGREWLVDSYGGIQEWSHHPPAYTTSLDAALTLVPERWTTASDASAPECGIDWELFEPRRVIDGARRIKGTGTTHALALCIAALRARQEAGKS